MIESCIVSFGLAPLVRMVGIFLVLEVKISSCDCPVLEKAHL